MNVTKACFKLLWDVGLEDLAKLLGYRTARALLCSQMCTDHHKAWMTLTIFLHGTMDEILSEYIKYSKIKHEKPTVKGLYNYISQSNDKNFRFICDVVFNILLAVHIYRCGVRRNNDQFIMASKSKFFKLFFGFNMTSYQEIAFRDLKCRALAPDDVRQFLNCTESFSVSGHSSKGEGGDFILEAFNRKTKRLLPPGIPTQQHWLAVCRNIDILHKVSSDNVNTTCLMPKCRVCYNMIFQL